MDHPKINPEVVKQTFFNSFKHLKEGLNPVTDQRLAEIYFRLSKEPCIVCGEKEATPGAAGLMQTDQINNIFFYQICDQCLPCSCEKHQNETQYKLGNLEASIQRARLH